jgi:hypothetical protein
LIADIEHGRDFKKYLSRAVEWASVTIPGGKRPDLDLMLNDWGVHHLHFSSTVEADGFVKRDGPLLFVSFMPHAAYLIDIMTHRDFVRDHVLEILASEWPNEGVIHEIKNAPLGSPITESQRANLRGNHYNAAFSFGGNVFTPRGLMMADGTTMTAWLFSLNVRNKIAKFEKALTANPRCLLSDFERSGLAFPDRPEFEFAIREDGPGIMETKTSAWMAL